ncbi:NLI interacting factor-like phosphatase-domain-containing protein [Tribonema minus]|uniref:Mitochondrial import inner membrane translocase subunit TIM50 n=1 Tax=Tribonema minus TaxID=303371 RepID=A0A836C7A9_9STRA|nr:NLI interacting factor-like phosphatase-domain-containing protein [Tribonema minus]
MVGPVCVQTASEAELPLGFKAASANLERLTVILDMDECLLHSKFHGLGSIDYRQQEERPEDIGEVNSFCIPLDDGVAQVNIRPGLHDFLEELAKTCDVVVFTAAMPDYAGPVLDKLDPTGRLISKRLYRSSCRQVRGAFLKDLSVLGPVFDKHPGRCVLLDNNPCSFLCQPTNGILVTSFYDDAEDTALASVLQLVQHLEHAPDVRPILRDMFRLESLLREYRAMLFPEEDEQQQEKENAAAGSNHGAQSAAADAAADGAAWDSDEVSTCSTEDAWGADATAVMDL